MDVEQLPSNRKFGFLFSAIFAISAIYFSGLSTILAGLFGLAALLTLIVAIQRPQFLEPFNKLWMKLGLILGILIRPVVLLVFFGGIFVPIGLFFRLISRDELAIRGGLKTSYWTQRDKSQSADCHFLRQY
jgi:hypothetical protein